MRHPRPPRSSGNAERARTPAGLQASRDGCCSMRRTRQITPKSHDDGIAHMIRWPAGWRVTTREGWEEVPGEVEAERAKVVLTALLREAGPGGEDRRRIHGQPARRGREAEGRGRVRTTGSV